MQVPFFSFAHMNAALGQTPAEVFQDFWEKQWYILGEKVLQFEAAYARWNEVSHCIGVANGLDALSLSLRALDIGPGDEVIVPSNTYIASWLAVTQCGATLTPVEPDPQTCNIDPARIEAAITPATRAIMPVHLYGLACDMPTIMQIAEKHGLWVVEDNAQAHGAQAGGKRCGAWGHLNATSFYPTKNLGALGDAGAITTHDAALAEKIRSLRNYGSARKYYNDVVGYNSRLDELQAGLLALKLPFLDAWTEERQRLAGLYHSLLADVPEIELPARGSDNSHVYHLFVIRSSRRDDIAARLNSQGIGTMVHYPVPPHLQKAYCHLGFKKGDFPIAERIAETCLSLPLYPGLKDAEVEMVCKAIRVAL